jgi:hypothetical protein
MMTDSTWYSPPTEGWNLDTALYTNGILDQDAPLEFGNDWLAYAQAPGYNMSFVSWPLRCSC